MLDKKCPLYYNALMYTSSSIWNKMKNNPVYGYVNDSRRREYYAYLKTEHWRNLRAAKLEKNPVCEKCGTYLSLDIHHIEYRDFYNVTIKDLQTLCRVCHNKEHEKQKLRKTGVLRLHYMVMYWFLKHIVSYCQVELESLRTKENKLKNFQISRINQRRREEFDKKHGNLNKFRSLNNYISIHY